MPNQSIKRSQEKAETKPHERNCTRTLNFEPVKVQSTSPQWAGAAGLSAGAGSTGEESDIAKSIQSQDKVDTKPHRM